MKNPYLNPAVRIAISSLGIGIFLTLMCVSIHTEWAAWMLGCTCLLLLVGDMLSEG